MNYRALPPGSLIGVIAPAGPTDPERLARVPALYAAAGYRARLYPGCAARAGYLAGDDATRLADLHAALADDEVAAIHALRGGYGCMRLLDRIDPALLRRHPKLLVGYSDLTALHALWSREGLASLHAPMAASDLLPSGPDAGGQTAPGADPEADHGAYRDAEPEAGRVAGRGRAPDEGRDADRQALFTVLRLGLRAGERLRPEPGLSHAPGLHAGGVAEGRLVGGNLSLVAALLGTPWAWDCRGAILFLEDVSEERYRLDRLLTQLRLAGVFDAAAGFLLGSFTAITDPGSLLSETLLPICRAQGKPLLAGWPSGHGRPNRPLPLGLRVRLDADAACIELREDLLPGNAE